MYDIFFGSLDTFKNALFFITLILFAVRVGGLTFFLKVLMKAAKIDFTNEKLKKYEDECFNVELFKLWKGVNVKTHHDAELIAEALSNGDIQKKDFLFTLFFGPLGIKKEARINVILMFLLVIFCFFSIGYLVYEAPPMKSGYALYNYKNERLLVSAQKIYNPITKEIISKEDCVNNTHNEVITAACQYITTEDIKLKDELTQAISNARTERTVYVLVLLAFFLLAGVSSIGYLNFFKVNKIIFQRRETNESNLIKRIKQE